MRLSDQAIIKLSRDAITDPKLIRFSDEATDIDVTLLIESITKDETYPIGTTAINMGNIVTGRWLWIRPSANIGLIINGGAALNLRANKTSRMWLDFTAVSLVVTGAPAQISVVIAGT